MALHRWKVAFTRAFLEEKERCFRAVPCCGATGQPQGLSSSNSQHRLPASHPQEQRSQLLREEGKKMEVVPRLLKLHREMEENCLSSFHVI